MNNISKLHTVPTDFVDLYAYESFVQTHLQTDYLHGRLTPSVMAIIGFNGTFVVPVGVTYRHTDSMLLETGSSVRCGNAPVSHEHASCVSLPLPSCP